MAIVTILGWALLAVALLGSGFALYSAQSEADAATDALIDPPRDQTNGETTTQRADMYASAQTLAVIAAGVAGIVVIASLVVWLVSGMGPATAVGLLLGLIVAVTAVAGMRSYGALATGAAGHLGELRDDRALASYPTARPGDLAGDTDRSTHGGA